MESKSKGVCEPFCQTTTSCKKQQKKERQSWTQQKELYQRRLVSTSHRFLIDSIKTFLLIFKQKLSSCYYSLFNLFSIYFSIYFNFLFLWECHIHLSIFLPELTNQCQLSPQRAGLTNQELFSSALFWKYCNCIQSCEEAGTRMGHCPIDKLRLQTVPNLWRFIQQMFRILTVLNDDDYDLFWKICPSQHCPQ